MLSIRNKSIVLIALFFGLSNSTLASDSEKGTTIDNPHVIGVFLGRTQTPVETESTYGIEYEYRFNSAFGAGVVLEKSGDAHHGDGVSVSLISAYYHLAGNWRLGLGVGKEKVHSTPSHSESLTRLSVSYDFHVGPIGLAPTFAIDRVNGENIKVWGLTVVKAF